MKELIMCKYGEIVLKGLNRGYFEQLLEKEMKKRIRDCGAFEVYREQSTLYIEPLDEETDVELAIARAKTVFGIVSVTRACVVDKTMDAILAAAKKYLPQFMQGVKTFKAEAKRSDKQFPYKSPELSAKVGAAVLEAMPRLKVDVNKPDVIVRVEIRAYGAYLHVGAEKGAGGIPTGSAGKALLLLSGGIDSPVAGYMMAKRGCVVEALHFESFPYTGEQAKEKVMELAKEVTVYTGNMQVGVISLTHIQEELVKNCAEEYFTLLLRRFMMRLSEKVAVRRGCLALITGESLGQVASQTMQALAVTDSVVGMPVYRPCIGMDKEEIITISRKIGTFDTSILPYEDCCTVFTPKHPKTKPELEKVLAEEAKVDVEALEEEAINTLQFVRISYYD